VWITIVIADYRHRYLCASIIGVRCLDLYCGAGGAGVGFARGGWDVTGIDKIARACGYPAGRFIKGDCLQWIRDLDWLRTFDFIHASPPCQALTRSVTLTSHQWGDVGPAENLIPQTRAALVASGVPFSIENVEHAPLRHDLVLCGTMFGLGVEMRGKWRHIRRHRAFELSVRLPLPGDCNHSVGRAVGVYAAKGDAVPGGGETVDTLEQGQMAMGIDWMNWRALTEAIPPAYTQWIGEQMNLYWQGKLAPANPWWTPSPEQNRYR